jgi:hypothetical protein
VAISKNATNAIELVNAYNSCRNRHCPKCQNADRAKWLENRKAELLPVEYFHVVFTVPEQIAQIAFYNKETVYNILFRATAETLLTIAATRSIWAPASAFFAMLHTWGQNLLHHPHLHCVVPGGGLSPDHERWIACRPGYFLTVEVLSHLFRRLFLEAIEEAFQNGDLKFFGELEPLSEAATFHTFLAPLRGAKWVVYAKPPFGGPSRRSPIWAGIHTASPYPITGLCQTKEDGLFPVERLPGRGQTEGHGGRSRRVHSTVSHPHVAVRIPAHPPLRLHGQLPSQGQAGHLQETADRSHCQSAAPTRSLPPDAGINYGNTCQPLRALRHWHNDPHRSAAALSLARIAAGYLMTRTRKLPVSLFRTQKQLFTGCFRNHPLPLPAFKAPLRFSSLRDR